MFVMEPAIFEYEREYFIETYQKNDFKDVRYELKFARTTS